MNTTNSTNTEADALNASLFLTPAQATAQKLVEQWEARCRELNGASLPGNTSSEALRFAANEIVKRIRELQAAFGIDSGSLGSAPQPPSDSETQSA